METRIVLLSSVGFLGFLSGLLALIAEAKKLTESDITKLSLTECVHPKSPALVLGVLSAMTLLIAQMMSNVLGGCICCEPIPNNPSMKNSSTVLAVSFLVISWITFSIAFLLLVAGAGINDRHDASDNLSSGCFILKSGVFTGAALLAFTTVGLGIAYNLQVASVRKMAYSNGTIESVANQGSSNVYSVGQPMVANEQHINITPSTYKQEAQKTPYARNAVNNHDQRNLNVGGNVAKVGQYETSSNDAQTSSKEHNNNSNNNRSSIHKARKPSHSASTPYTQDNNMTHASQRQH